MRAIEGISYYYYYYYYYYYFIIINLKITISLLTYTKQIAIYKLKVHKRTIESYLQFISILLLLLLL